MAPKVKPPEIGPFVFPAILAFFGLWCLYDGWLTTDPNMQEHLLFNRIAGGILVPWAVIDFFRTRKRERTYAEEEKKKEQNSADNTAENTLDQK